MPPASILDLVTYWAPHPSFPGVWQFKTKYALMGFAWEDGKTLHVLELHPQAEPKLLICLKFMAAACARYDLVLVELVRKKDLFEALIRAGFVGVSIRTAPRESYWAKVTKTPSGIWIAGMAWNHSVPHGALVRALTK